jgi:hypothetical protein
MNTSIDLTASQTRMLARRLHAVRKGPRRVARTFSTGTLAIF